VIDFTTETRGTRRESLGDFEPLIGGFPIFVLVVVIVVAIGIALVHSRTGSWGHLGATPRPPDGKFGKRN
jgi:hypothetical protein